MGNRKWETGRDDWSRTSLSLYPKQAGDRYPTSRYYWAKGLSPLGTMVGFASAVAFRQSFIAHMTTKVTNLSFYTLLLHIDVLKVIRTQTLCQLLSLGACAIPLHQTSKIYLYIVNCQPALYSLPNYSIITIV